MSYYLALTRNPCTTETQMRANVCIFHRGHKQIWRGIKTINTTQGIGIKITEVTEGEFSLRVWPDVELGAVWR